MPIEYVVGDATDLAGYEPKMIVHVCNDLGKWGAGFSGAISRHWKRPEQDYRNWHARIAPVPEMLPPFALGYTWITYVGDMTWVASMIAQHGIRGPRNPVPIRYSALRTCLASIAPRAREHGASIHMPRIGCGLAGGTWDRIEPLITTELCDRGIPVTVYDLPARR